MSALITENGAVVATTPAALKKRLAAAGHSGTADIEGVLTLVERTGKAKGLCPVTLANLDYRKRGFWVEVTITPMHVSMPVEKTVRLFGG